MRRFLLLGMGLTEHSPSSQRMGALREGSEGGCLHFDLEKMVLDE